MTAAVSTPIPQHARVYPHWFCHQQQWVADPARSDSPTYNFPFHLRIRGPLDFSRVKNTIGEIISRQEMLRSTFSISAGELLWWISGSVLPEIPKTDLRHLPEEKALIRANEIAVEETLRPFDFSSGLLLRSHLIQIQHQDYILLLVSNHLIFDDWSVGVFYKEFTRLYRAFTEPTSQILPKVSFQYHQFLDLQTRQLKGPGLTRRISFWRATFTIWPKTNHELLSWGFVTEHGLPLAFPPRLQFVSVNLDSRTVSRFLWCCSLPFRFSCIGTRVIQILESERVRRIAAALR